MYVHEVGWHGRLPPVPTTTPPKSPVEYSGVRKIRSPSGLLVQTIKGAKIHVWLM